MKDCDEKKWTLFKRHDGTEVKVRDVLEKVAHWVRRFEKVGDVAVSFDPVHAALPWAGVKVLIEVAVSDFETYAKMADGLEIASRVIVQFAEVEKGIPIAAELSGLKAETTRTIVDTYIIVLKFLATAKKYFIRSTPMRWLKNLFQRLQSAVKDLVDGIAPKISELYRLSTEIKLQDSSAQSAQRHGEILSQLQELSKLLTRPNVTQQQRARIRKWLGPIFTDDSQTRALKSRHGTTCDWFLARPAFVQWTCYQPATAQILWIHAPAGFGKSVLCATVIRSMQEDEACYGKVLFFHCSGQHKSRKHPFAILKSWIGQLVAHVDEAVDVFMKDEHALQNMDDGTVTSEAEDHIWTLFSKLMMIRDSRWTLVIDGYDECEDMAPEQSKYDTQRCRPDFIKRLTDAIRGRGVRVLLVSRKHADIERALREAHEANSHALELIEYEIIEDDTKDDLWSYSNAIFERKVGKNKAVKDLASDAVNKSKGMFLWMALLDKNLEEGATRKELRKLVEKTPSEVYDAYRAELDKILDPKNHHVERAVTIMKWILYASRPLTVREVTEALAVSFNEDQDHYPLDDLPDDFPEGTIGESFVQNYIRMPCGSLVDVRKTSEDTPLGECTVEFVHFSVEEFLKQSQWCIRSSDRTLCFGAPNTEHDWIATLCLRYMCYDEFTEASENGLAATVTSFLQTYPFFAYTAGNWFEHYARGDGSETRSETGEAVWSLFDTTSWRLWAELFEQHLHERNRDPTGLALRPGSGERADSGYESLGLDAPDVESELGGDSTQSDDESNWGLSDSGSMITTSVKKAPAISPSPVYYAAMLGLVEVIDRLISLDHDCKLKGGELGCPLQAAVVCGQTAAVRALLGHHSDPSQPAGKYGTPLIAAVLLGSDDIFDQLLEAAKEGGLDAVDTEGKTALYHACALGSLKMVTQLVQAGANTTIKAKKSRKSPLICAVMRDHQPVVEFLLDNGVDANERGWNEETPLMFAVRSANVEMARLLLQHEADPNLANKWGGTALHIACYESSTSLVQLLLDQPMISAEVKDHDDWTPLHFAAQENASEVAQLLLSRGASPFQGGRFGYTPFELAANRSSRAVLEVFIKQEFSGETTLLVEVLSLAGDCRYEDLLESLVQGLREPALPGAVVRDIMELALKSDSQCLFSELVNHMRKGSEIAEDANVVDEPQESFWSEEEASTIRNTQWGTANQKDMVLHSIWGSYAEANMVLPDAMLPVAVGNRASDVVSLLLKRGADVHRRVRFRASRRHASSEPATPLLMAVIQNSRELVALMLENDRGRGDGDRGLKLLMTVEDLGSGCGMSQTELTRLLIEHGALDGHAAGKDDASSGVEDDDDSGIEDEGSDSGDEGSGIGGDGGASHDLAWWESVLVGEWEGEYTYKSLWRSGAGDPTSFKVDSVASKSLRGLDKDATLFDGGGTDTVSDFVITGQVQSGSTVRFVKLYPRFGWMYEGSVGQEEGKWRMRGTWGSKFGKSNVQGGFTLTKKED